jgi:hypothetical protein
LKTDVRIRPDSTSHRRQPNEPIALPGLTAGGAPVRHPGRSATIGRRAA